MIPTCVPAITPQDLQAVHDALAAGHVAQGPEVEAFEQAVAAVTGYPYAVATSSGSMGLYAALRAYDVGPGDQITLPALTFTATAEAVRQCGALPVIVDLDQEVDISVYLYGAPPAQEAAFLTDACEALGSRITESTAVLSFNGNKIITTGAGGMVLTTMGWVARKVRHLISHCKTGEWQHDGVGMNGTMPAMNAALGLSQLQRLNQHVSSKRDTVCYYAAELGGVGLGIKDSNAWMPLTLLDRPARPIIDALRADGVEARAVFTPLNRLPAYKGPHAPTPKADDLWQRGLLLPCSVGITWEEREQVVSAVRRALCRGTSAPAPAS